MKSEKREKKERPERIKKPKSTTTILWRYFVLLIFSLLFIVLLVSYFVLGRATTDQAKQRLEKAGEDMIEYMLSPETDDEGVLQRITEYAMRDGINIFAFDDGGIMFGALSVSEDVRESIQKSLNENLGEWAEDKTVEYTARESGGLMLSYGACFTYGGKQCKLVVRYPIASVNRALKQIERYSLLASGGVLVLAFFIAYTLANKLSKPLRDISVTAQNLAKGDYSVEFNSVEYAEIANLSDTLNYMKNEIKKSDEFQKEILANVSHDLKTPLTMIKAYASMIQEISGDDPEKRQKHLQVIIDESDRLAGLVNDILSTSKINAGIEQTDRKVFNVTEVLYGVINSFGYLQESQGYNIMVDIDANQYTYADEEKIKQVMYNLISNAVNYTGEDKTVYVSLKFIPQNNSLKFSVRDTGKGIAPDELEHIWDRYYRSSEMHNRPVKGMGLGLNIVKTILENHSFNFGVDSKPGEGSTFFVELPSVPSEPVPLKPEN